MLGCGARAARPGPRCGNLGEQVVVEQNPELSVRVEQGVETVTQTRSGMVLMRRDSTGRLVKSRGALPNEERLDEFLTKVRSIVERNAGGIRE